MFFSWADFFLSKKALKYTKYILMVPERTDRQSLNTGLINMKYTGKGNEN
jgi:hypothetical protein